MDESTIIKTINTALADEFELDPELLHESAHIRDDLGLDSLDIVDMVIVLEKAFHFKLTNREALADIQTLGDIYAFIGAQRGSRAVQEEA